MLTVLFVGLLVSCQEALIYESVDADAAAIYLSLAEGFPPIPADVAEFAGGSSGDPVEIRKALQPFEKILGRLHEAARARRCEWRYPGREKHGEGFPHLVVGVGAARVLAARCRLRLETGEIDGAIADALVGWRVGTHHLSDGPLFSGLVGMLAIVLTDYALQRSLPARTLSSAQLRRLAIHAEAAVSRFPPFRRTMEGEKALALGGVEAAIRDFPGLISTLERIGGGPPKPEKKDGALAVQWKEVQELLQADPAASRKRLRKRVEEVWEDVLHDADQPIGSSSLRLDMDALKKRPMEKWKAYQVGGDAQAGLEAVADMYVSLILPAVEKPKLRLAESRLGLALQARWCRLELHFKEQGRYPEALDDFRPAILDPWDGKGIKYRRIGGSGRVGFVLTASGPKGDWEERIRILAEKCDFDLDKFIELGLGETDSGAWTLWQIRRP